MIANDLIGLGMLFGFLIPLVIFQHALHREIQFVLLLLTRRKDWSIIIFSLLFLPGVFLHEISHYVAALLMGVRTGRFSVIPRALPGGEIQLGFVETAPVDFLRATIIGLAPLISGIAFISFIGFRFLNLPGLWEQIREDDLRGIWDGVIQLQAQPDFWLWFYLVLTVSSMMLPSASDRKAWLPLGIMVGVLLLFSIFLGGGSWILLNLVPALNQFLLVLAGVFAISLFAHVLLYLPTRLSRWLVSRLAGVKVT